ncbi:MAG TPA: amidohydrolase family protein, partial [Polyangiales bacterium]
DLKHAINAGSVPGPRLWVSARGLSTPGRYEPFEASWELSLPTGAQFVVGEQEARAAVREHIAHGADWIKVYADFFPLSLDANGEIRGLLNFTDQELQTIVSEAHRLGHKVAAHAISRDGIAQALGAGVDSLEHAHGLSADLAERARANGVFVVPTLFAESAVVTGAPPELRAVFERGYVNLAQAFRTGVKMAFGSDSGCVPWSENAAAGFAMYVERLGMSPAQALQAATTSAAELLGEAGALGQLTAGALADAIAVRGDPLRDARALQEVTFVMKAGAIVRAP